MIGLPIQGTRRLTYANPDVRSPVFDPCLVAIGQTDKECFSEDGEVFCACLAGADEGCAFLIGEVAAFGHEGEVAVEAPAGLGVDGLERVDERIIVGMVGSVGSYGIFSIREPWPRTVASW